MRGGSQSFSVGNEFCVGARPCFCVLVRFVVPQQKRSVVRRLLQLSTEANGFAAAGVGGAIRCKVSMFGDGCRIVTGDTRSRVATSFHHSFPPGSDRLADPFFTRVAKFSWLSFSCRPRQVDGDGAAKRRRLRRPALMVAT